MEKSMWIWLIFSFVTSAIVAAETKRCLSTARSIISGILTFAILTVAFMPYVGIPTEKHDQAMIFIGAFIGMQVGVTVLYWSERTEMKSIAAIINHTAFGDILTIVLVLGPAIFAWYQIDARYNAFSVREIFSGTFASGSVQLFKLITGWFGVIVGLGGGITIASCVLDWAEGYNDRNRAFEHEH